MNQTDLQDLTNYSTMCIENVFLNMERLLDEDEFDDLGALVFHGLCNEPDWGLEYMCEELDALLEVLATNDVEAGVDYEDLEAAERAHNGALRHAANHPDWDEGRVNFERVFFWFGQHPYAQERLGMFDALLNQPAELTLDGLV